MRIPQDASPDIQQAFRDVAAVIAPLEQTRAIDLKQRRIVNLGDGTENDDAITKGQVDTLLSALRDELGANTTEGPEGALNGASGKVRVGTYAVRGSAQAHAGELFLASDRNYVAWVSTGSGWKYAVGMQYGTLSPDLKPTLTTDDANYLFFSTDFWRGYRWTGSAWQDAPGQADRGQISYFDENLPPLGAGTYWVLCDGSTVTRSKGDGTTASYTTVNLTGANRFIRSVAVTTGGTGGSATTHTHSVNVASTGSSAPSATSVVQSGAGSTVASSTHTHDTDPAAVTSAAPSGAGGDDALPPYMNLRPYIRL